MRLNYYKKKEASKEKIVDQKNYDEMTIFELKRLGILRKIRYCGSIPKVKNIEMLKANDEDPTVTSYQNLIKNVKKKAQKSGTKI